CAGANAAPHRAVRARPLPARPRDGRPGVGGHALMHELDCPRCGRRPLDEFTFGGERRATPDGLTDPDDRDFDEAWVFENPSGVATERWFHAAGCRRWLTVRRDTSLDRVLEVRCRPTATPGAAWTSWPAIEPDLGRARWPSSRRSSRR